jgi:anti-sigma factor RsiW
MTESSDGLITERGDHPDELLAELADGTLDERDRAGVEAHLASCRQCRDELLLALRGVAAVSAFPEVDVPVGLTRAVVDGARPARAPRRVWAWAAAPAAAAVVALTVWAALAGGGGGQAPERAGASSAAGGGAVAVPRPLDSRVRVSKENFDQAKIQALAGKLASRGARDQFAVESAPDRTADRASKALLATDPIACIRATAQPTKNDQLLEVLVARFEGRPAFVAVFVHRPGAGQPPSLLAIWVASQSGCQLLHYASEPLNR